MNTKKISSKILRNQKPTEYDVHLKYICTKCGQIHWLSFDEASTKYFKVVCFCGNVFGVKRIKSYRVLFYNKKSKPAFKTEKDAPDIKEDLLDQTIKILIGYGFTKTEAKELIKKSYRKSPVDNSISLVKQILESLGAKNVK